MLLWMIGGPVGWLCLFGVVPGHFGDVGPGAYWSSGICFALGLLSVTPTDDVCIIRQLRLHTFWFLFMFVCLLYSAFETLRTGCKMQGFEMDVCHAWNSTLLACAIPCAVGCVIAINAQRRNKGAYVLCPRLQLKTAWIAVRVFYLGNGTIMGMGLFLVSHADASRNGTFMGSPQFYGYVVCSLIWTSFGMLTTKTNRRRFMAVALKFLVEGEVEAAASIAAATAIASTMKSLGIKKTIELAKKTFRGVALEALTLEVLASNCNDDRLFAMTVPAKLGLVDAFISHSWSDLGDLKHTAMQRWRRNFVTSKGREPLVWFDKACINQGNIRDSLACLPVFLAGCSELVVLVGSTYAERLWCCIELFTFLRMGGSLDRITVIPIDHEHGEQSEGEISDTMLERFKSFDAQHAKCFDENDRQHLLSIIETGFGDFRTFNEVVRHAFVSRCTMTKKESVFSASTCAGSVSVLPEFKRSGSRDSQLAPVDEIFGASIDDEIDKIDSLLAQPVTPAYDLEDLDDDDDFMLRVPTSARRPSVAFPRSTPTSPSVPAVADIETGMVSIEVQDSGDEGSDVDSVHI